MKVKRLRGLGWLSLRVDELGEGGVERTVVLEDAWLQPLLTPQFRTTGAEVQVDFRAHRIADNVDAKGTAATRVAYACSRCGSDAVLPLQTEFEVLFVPAGSDNVNLADDGEGADLGGDFAMEEIRGGVVDLEAALAEAVVLAMPAYPLCREDCRGVCPACGANRNEETCTCGAQPTDARFAVLAKLRDRLPPSPGEAGGTDSTDE